MKKLLLGLLITASLVGTGIGAQYKIPSAKTSIKAEAAEKGVTIYFKCESGTPSIYYWNSNPKNLEVEFPGVEMELDSTQTGGNWYKATFSDVTKINMLFSVNGVQTADLTRKTGTWWYKDNKWYNKNPEDNSQGGGGEALGGDFRDETIYFVMTTRFYDGDSSNNVHCWDDKKAGNPDSDPAWRGDFKGLIEKLDYIKAMGFSAIWITPVVKNMSAYDYHGYHAVNFNEVDPRYESEGATYQDLINAAHAKGLKIIQDVVFNHTSNNGEENLFPLVTKTGGEDTFENAKRIDGSVLPENYDSLDSGAKHTARYEAMKGSGDPNNIYHHQDGIDYEGFTATTGQFADDCVDLNTENPTVYNYLIDAYTKYIKMGVDAFRVDTVKHISRLTFNETFLPAFMKAGGDDFYMFGECAARVNEIWNRGVPPVSSQFYTWKEEKDYGWSDTDALSNCKATENQYKDNTNVATQRTSNNAFLNGNEYHTPDYSQRSHLDMIDFTMHWNFDYARNAFQKGLEEDKYYNDSTWNVVYVDSHDYGPNTDDRYDGGTDNWAENLDLMFTFRGIPCLYYGSEVEFQKGKKIDYGNTAPLSTSGRAYFGDYLEGSVDVTDYGEYSNATGTMAETLNSTLSKHIQRLNKIRRAVPALSKGQYSTEGISGDAMAYKKRYTGNGVDSFACVAISGSATFTGIPAGTYTDAITGKTIQCNGTLTTDSVGKGNMRVYVLNGPGKIGEDGEYLK
ncbi:MAG: alpha-amylase family glycosyl hydrolase [Clostridium sp.]